MAGGLAIKFSGTVMDLLLPWILAYMIDHVAPQGRIVPIFLWGGLMAVCSLFAFAGNVTANRMASAVAGDITRVIRRDLFKKVFRLSCAQIDRISIPSLVARLSSDTYNIHRMLSSMQRIGIRAPILLLGGILISLTLEPVLTLVLTAILPFTFGVIALVSRKGTALYTGLQNAVDAVVRIVRENATGIRIIKALSKTDYEKQRFARANNEMTSRELKANIIMGISNPAMFLFINLGLVAVIITGAYRVNAGRTQPGTILAFLTYFTIILNATLSITRMFVMYSRGSASGARIAEVLALPDDLVLKERAHEDSPYYIRFENVGFTYPVWGDVKPAPRTETAASGVAPLLSGISFALKRGETLGILGETGCGKSAVIQLLLRFYDADSGRIWIDGDDIRGIPADELYRKFGVVFQRDTLFADTVRENIAFGRALSEEDLRRAVRYAQAEEFTAHLENGLDYNLSARGTNLSGGQRQRILIARAVAAGPEILILDDSSSALDYQTDADLRLALDRHFRGTTKIIVAQRISSIIHADHILVLERGRMLGYGTHTELLRGCPLYREISESQMGGRYVR
jgi:ATP-binding cassette subfamily B protein